jgi:cation transporter-like permease
MSLALYFFALSLIAAVLYHRFGYDPEGTIKPAWTEQLG